MPIFRSLTFVLSFCVGLSVPTFVNAAPEAPDAKIIDQKPWHDSGNYRVHFSTFTSDFLAPETAAALKFTRAKDQIVVNIALTEKGADGLYSLGKPAKVTGTATNLLQQQKTLSFVEVNETGATYYLAPQRFTNEETLHFDIQISTDAGDVIKVKFSRMLYVNNQ